MPRRSLDLAEKKDSWNSLVWGESQAGLHACNLQPLNLYFLQIAKNSLPIVYRMRLFCQRKSGGTMLAVTLCQIGFRRDAMADLIFIFITVVFFTISLAYVGGCERL
jgi:hypothetical protein